ncbi:HD domain-containing protein [Streptomyces sp. PCS3-D2]|uniref:HD domain-containing protein n=1 Tax=Streptomyces sp. PCS3-D2 TaxID=1460244 RepID=UPI00044BEFFD|nr:HD domain-containing protein [Streptomyces sp. PCS3-D2]WKV74178.1 HD domain-containing protein [Streptomyces sp. PCS3-D2]
MKEDALALWDALGADGWTPDEQRTAAVCVPVALAIYDGRTRDQGTPYVEHPAAVVRILRDELRVTCTTALMVGLLHDALEVSPESRPVIAARLGEKFADRIAAITPDHRLQGRAKGPGDREAWRAKTSALAPVPLVIRFADRIHNLRDLSRSPDAGRRDRYIEDLVEFQLPLAERCRHLSPHLAAAAELLRSEYHRYEEKEERRGTDRVLHGTDRPDRRQGVPPHAPRGDR